MVLPSTGKTTRGGKRYDSFIEQYLKPFGVWEAGAGWWRSCCPVHRGGNPSAFSINRFGKWRCFACGESGDMPNLLMRVERIPFRQAQEMIKDAPTPFGSISALSLLPPFEERKQGKQDYTTLREADIILHVDQCPVYLINRGFSRSALKAYEIGYDTSKSRIVLPIRDVHGDLVGITYRTDFPDGMLFKGRAIKYWHDHFDKSKHLYGFHRLAGKKINEIFLVEGQLDVLRLHQLGHAAVGVMGSAMSDRQMDLLKRHARCSKLVLAFDNDDAGKEATRRTAKRLVGSRFGRNMYCAIYPTNDPGELREYHQIKYQHWTKRLMKGSK